MLERKFRRSGRRRCAHAQRQEVDQRRRRMTTFGNNYFYFSGLTGGGLDGGELEYTPAQWVGAPSFSQPIQSIWNYLKQGRIYRGTAGGGTYFPKPN